MKRFSIALVLMILSVTACSGPATLDAQATPESATPVAKTAPPTGTPAPEPTVAPTLILTPVPDMIGTVVAAGQPQIIASHLSPDGQWRAEVVAYECVQVGEIDEGHMVEQLTLIRVSDGEQTTVDSQQISCSAGLGAYGMGGWFWSPNSRYFYYTDAREGVPDGGGGLCWDRSLIRLDVTDGSVNRLGRIWAVSPEGTTAAMWQEDDLVLWDLDGGEIARTPVLVPEAEVCEIAWSPEDQALAYLQTSYPFGGPGKFYLVHLDLRGLQHTLLLELEEHSFVAIEWEIADQIGLSGYKGGEEWMLDLPVELNVQEIAPPPGLVYSSAGGLWRVDADEQPVLISTRTDVTLSSEALAGAQGGQALFSQAVSATADDTDIWILDLDTGKERNLTEGSGRIEYFPQWWPARPDVVILGSWSPDDDLGPSTGFLTAVRVDGSGYRVLDEESQSNAHPAPAPDGRTIAYDRGGTAWFYRWDLGPEPFGPAAYGLPARRIGSPAWSPDGKRLAWVVGGDFEGKWQLGVGVFDLEAQTSLLLHPYEPVGVGGWPAAPVWSPDGQWLAYTLWPADDPAEAGLWVLRADGTEEHFLGAGSGPTWGPDGRWLSFNPDEEPGLWLVEVGAWRPQQIALPPTPSAVAPDDGLTCLAVPQVSIEVCFPHNYSLSRNTGANRRGSFISYDFLPTDGYQTPYLSEIQSFSENSIDEFTRDCGESTPCFFGDYPDLNRYYGQREALKALEGYQDFGLQSFNGRHFLTVNRPCHGDDCVIREYTTFLGDVKLDIWVTMADESQIGQSDRLFTQLLIRDSHSRRLRCAELWTGGH